MQDTSLPQIGFVRLPKVLEIIPISRAAWYAGIAEGDILVR